MSKARRGRPRNPGKRTKSGQLSRSKNALQVLADAQKVTVLEQPHRRWLSEEKRKDQRAECELGRLFLGGMITETQCWAGEKFRNLMREYRVVMVSPVTRISAASIAVSERVETPAEADYLANERPESDEEKRDRVLDAFNALQGAWARSKVALAYDTWRELIAVVDEDRPVANISSLRGALGELVRFWRLEPDEKADKTRSIVHERPAWEHGRVNTIIYIHEAACPPAANRADSRRK